MCCTSAIQTEVMRRAATHTLEGISWVARQRFKWRSKGAQQLTIWKGFHVLHVSESNRGQEAHGNSNTGRDFIRCTSAFQTKVRRRTATHILEGISCVARQRFKQRSGDARQLTPWKGFHELHVSDSNRDLEAHSNSHTGRDFMGCKSAIQAEARRRTATHMLEGISWVASQRFKQRPGGARQLTSWKGFHGLHVSNSNGDQEAHGNSQTGRDWDFMGHVSDSNGDQEAHRNSRAGRDFMCCTSAIQTEARRRTTTHHLNWVNCFFVVNLKSLRQLAYYLYVTFRIFLPFTLKILPFPPYYSHNQHIVRKA